MSGTSVAAVRQNTRLPDSSGNSGSKRPTSRRLLERFRVPGAMAECRRRLWFFFWKRTGPLCKVYDMCLRGVSLQNRGKKLKLKSTVRLNILLAPEMWVRVKAQVVWVKDKETQQGQFCGVQFTDFSGEAWANLCLIYEKYREGRDEAGSDLLAEFDIKRLQEETCDITEALNVALA